MITKQLKKHGGSLVISFDKEDIEWYNLKEGEWLDIGDIVKVKKGDKHAKSKNS